MAVYTHKAFMKKLDRIAQKVKEDTTDEIIGACQFGSLIAKQTAPIDEGHIIRNIIWKKAKNNQGWIIQKNPGYSNPSRYGKKKGTPFNYAYAMNSQSGSKGAAKVINGKMVLIPWKNHIKTGDPDYMTRAGKEAYNKLKVRLRVLTGRAISIK